MPKIKINTKPVSLPRCHAEWPLKVERAFRDVLRSEMALIMHDALHGQSISNTALDAAIEQAWNAAVVASGHDKK